MKYQCQNCRERHKNCHDDCIKYKQDQHKAKTLKKQKQLDDISYSAGNHSWNYHRSK